jgi:hypothetical protein
MKLYKLIKLKKQLIGELSSLSKKIKTGNTSVLPSKPLYDTKELFSKYNEVYKRLINIKVVLMKNTLPIYPQIFEISELKSKLSLLNSMTFKDGLVSERRSFSDSVTVTEYFSTIKRIEVDEIIRGINDEINELQDKIDEYNYSTEVDYSE